MPVKIKTTPKMTPTMTNRITRTIGALIMASFVTVGSGDVLAADKAPEVTLRAHHFMSSKANLHTKFLVPFAESIAAASDGRIKIEIFDSMSRGGPPSGLYDRAVGGADDIILTLPGYTSGRFNRSEVFELPFIMEDPVATSKAFWDLTEAELQDDEFQDVKILASWVHGPGVLHADKPITSLEDMKGRELRGPTRVVTDLLGELGASPVGMPLPKIPENLSKGVISGASLPWEVTPSIKLGEMVKNHTEFGGERALYTATFILAMSWDTYEALPADLRDIIDAQSGKSLSQFAGEVMSDADKLGRDEYSGNNIVTLPASETARWIEAATPVYDRWIERAATKGFDGKAAIAQAQKLIAANK
ncbi:TRAP transporter substrate-binding protein [Alphaproteobacteria bacterium]|nr:TRAP transporter substrate-binding protein [Alphaproteobacteria bacterium]